MRKQQPPTGRHKGFALELRKLRRARGLMQDELAPLLGVSGASVSVWEQGHFLPDHGLVVKMADLLTSDLLVTLALAVREGNCGVCGAQIMSTRGRRKWCSKTCARVHRYRRDHPGAADWRSAGARLKVHQAAVAAFCRGCEPEGLCLTPACALRPVSPLPLARVA